MIDSVVYGRCPMPRGDGGMPLAVAQAFDRRKSAGDVHDGVNKALRGALEHSINNGPKGVMHKNPWSYVYGRRSVVTYCWFMGLVYPFTVERADSVDESGGVPGSGENPLGCIGVFHRDDGRLHTSNATE